MGSCVSSRKKPNASGSSNTGPLENSYGPRAVGSSSVQNEALLQHYSHDQNEKDSDAESHRLSRNRCSVNEDAAVDETESAHCSDDDDAASKDSNDESDENDGRNTSSKNSSDDVGGGDDENNDEGHSLTEENDQAEKNSPSSLKDNRKTEPGSSKIYKQTDVPVSEAEEKSDDVGIESFEWPLPDEMEDQNEKMDKILNGYLNIAVPSQIRIVRIFTSSTFTDTNLERNTLMERVYPKLKTHCQSKGYDFQVVDMRWGVRDAATDDHLTTELCMKELEACQRNSTGPNFITFLGQKYGYRPFPAKIFEKEFDVMLSYVQSEEDRELLEKWFKRDDNLMPAMNVLQPITELVPNYNNHSVTAEERGKASSEWWSSFERMQVVLRDASENCLLNEEEIARYKISVTENEIRRGILDVKDRKKHCFWFKRNITDIEDNIGKKKARFFIDKDSVGVDQDAVSMLNTLKSKVADVLSNENIKEYDVKWDGENGINPKENEEHNSYLEKLCVDFHDVLAGMIDKGIEEKSNDGFDDGLLKEIILHITTCHAKTAAFYGRKDVLDSIINHIDSDNSNRVVVVHGESGCGKTSIMAVAAKTIKEMYPEVPVILRFLGTTTDSSSIRNLLQSICTQIYKIRGKSKPEFPKTFREMISFFESTLKKVKSKMVIMLDSLDQLSSEDGALSLKWIPKKIKKKLTIIVSTLPGDEYKAFPALKSRLPEDALIEVPKMPSDTAGLILNAWMKNAKRRVTPKQREIVLNAFNECKLPLFLKLAFDQTLRWKSYTPVDEIHLPTSVKETIVFLFETLERLHGEKLVKRSLGYLTAAKNGLTDAEMDDILSLDDEVLNDVYQYWTPPIRRIPPLLWIRIKTDLSSYIITRGADGVVVNTWYHRQFIETAREKYLDGEHAQDIHKKLVEFFIGKWSGIPKPFVNKVGDTEESDRLVPSQPNIFSKVNDEQEVFNYRKLNELPYHLARAGDLDSAKEHVLTNFDFLQSKLRAVSWASLLQDIKEASSVFNDAEDVALLRDCIQMSGEFLLADPNQLPAQLIGRLSHLHMHSDIIKLLEEAKAANVPCLYPSLACFEKPGGPLAHSLAGHGGTINWGCVSKDGGRLLTISEDQTLKLWDVSSGEEISSYEMEGTYEVVKFYNEDKCAVVAGFFGMWAVELDSDIVVYREHDLPYIYGKCMDVLSNGTKLVHIGPEKIRVYSMEGKEIKLAWEYEETAVKNENGIADIITGFGNFYAYTRGNEKELIVRRTDDKEFVKLLQMPYGLRHFQFHDDQLYTIGTNSAFQTTQKMHLVIWNCSTWKITSDKESQFHPMLATIYDMSISEMKDGLTLVWPVFNKIYFWNLQTGKEFVTLRASFSAGMYKQSLNCARRRLAVVSSDINQKAVSVYNIDFLEMEERSDDSFTQTEQTKNYVGGGEREAYFSHQDPSVILSIPYTDAVVNVWDSKYRDQVYKIILENAYNPWRVHLVDEKHIAIWDLQTKKIACVNIVEKSIKFIEGNIGEILSHYEAWHYFGDFQMLATSNVSNELNLWNLKTGELVKKYNIQRTEKISSLIVSEDDTTALVSLMDDSRGESKLPVVCIDLTSQTIRSTIFAEEQWIQLLPNQTVLSSDGEILYLVFWGRCIHVFDTTNGKEVKKIWYTAESKEDSKLKPSKDYTTFYYIDASSASGYLVAYLSCQVIVDDDDTETKQHLVVFDLKTHEVLAWRDCIVYQDLKTSKDGSRMLCKGQGLQNASTCFELWDMSGFRSHRLTLIGRFVPDSGIRFGHLTLDGDSVCCGFTDVDGLVFFQPCGTKPQSKRAKNCKEVKMKFIDK